ncbi:calcium-binding protein [Streptomyces uncialis]|uniref:calcium-binding protein n=1 Tax=Streptomyces uncialis TaxID=1048205 RepID=UPI0038701D3C|nr:calcium-binding protein [Streptomyces uncialis]
MRTRASAAVLTGALALSVLAVPAAHASGGDSGALARFAAPTAAATGKITKVTVNGGKTIAVGTSKKKFTVEVSASDRKGVTLAVAALYRGTVNNPSAVLVPDTLVEHDPCKRTATTATCKWTVVADPKADLANQDAGTWKVLAAAIKFEEDGEDKTVAENLNYKSAKLVRAAKLTANATPEPVKKGKTLTISGALTRASWDNLKYNGFASNSVKLQYKKKGAGAWTTVKTVKADSRGTVKTTVKASADGDYRFTYGGSGTTGSATSVADFVDVR